MTEKLLQFIWQYRHFNQHDLFLESGESIFVIFPGHLNSNQGPDFLNAKIKIERATWVGHIELHLRSSDWKKHAHDTDRNYTNVMLHVVWENDQELPRRNIPMLVIQQRVSKLLLEKYMEWMGNGFFIPCMKNIRQVGDIIWTTWKQRLLAERLQRRSVIIQQYLEQNNEHWEETLWWLIAANFGIKVNAGVFETIARSLSIQLLGRHKNQIHQLEALLLGQAGLLEDDFEDAYPRLLQKEYGFLRNKYHLQPVCESVHFLRMRPGHFPTIRLAQLAALIHGASHLFSRIKEAGAARDLRELLTVTASDYWHNHYIFDIPSSFKNKTLGKQMIENIIINTIVPVVHAYGWLSKNEPYMTKAIEWLETIAAEKNSIIQQWKEIKIEAQNACDSQALLELKNNYCDSKRCLECAIGNAILKVGE